MFQIVFVVYHNLSGIRLNHIPVKSYNESRLKKQVLFMMRATSRTELSGDINLCGTKKICLDYSPSF